MMRFMVLEGLDVYHIHACWIISNLAVVLKCSFKKKSIPMGLEKKNAIFRLQRRATSWRSISEARTSVYCWSRWTMVTLTWRARSTRSRKVWCLAPVASYSITSLSVSRSSSKISSSSKKCCHLVLPLVFHSLSKASPRECSSDGPKDLIAVVSSMRMLSHCSRRLSLGEMLVIDELLFFFFFSFVF